MADTNFSLLSQEEIDILIAFLTNNYDQVGSEVLSQESIDKLILMMKSYSREQENEALQIRSSTLTENGEWQLEIAEDAQGFVEMYAIEGQQREKITPKGYSARCFLEDDSKWGFSISPDLFVKVAKAYGLKFTEEMYQSVVNRFASKNFGDSSYVLDAFFLPEESERISCLL